MMKLVDAEFASGQVKEIKKLQGCRACGNSTKPDQKKRHTSVFQ